MKQNKIKLAILLLKLINRQLIGGQRLPSGNCFASTICPLSDPKLMLCKNLIDNFRLELQEAIAQIC